jgi:4-hydroxybenzoate polyprenyltransferase
VQASVFNVITMTTIILQRGFLWLLLTAYGQALISRSHPPWKVSRSLSSAVRDFRRMNDRMSWMLFYTETDRSHHQQFDTNDASQHQKQKGKSDKSFDQFASSLFRTLDSANRTTSNSLNPVVPIAAVPAVMPTTVGLHGISKPHVFDYTKELIAMVRPENLPGVVLFHLLGSCLAYRHCERFIAESMADYTSFFQLLSSPSMMITLSSLLLVSSTSMLVNDYYDYKLGNDSLKINKPLQKVPLAVVKSVLMHLYAVTLLCGTMVPGVPARVAVVSGLMLTFLYTKHVKPKTWAKNALCASLVAVSPLTSGMAAMTVLSESSSQLLLQFVNWPLLRLVTMLFVGIMGREISMDINDIEDDSVHSVQTVPVVYGRPYASHVAWICSLAVAALAVSGPALESMDSFVTIRRASLAGMGSLLQMRRFWTVVKTEGLDSRAIDVAIDEGLLSMVLLLASFV